MSQHRTHKGNGLLPYPILKAASQGDVSAMDTVLQHYDRYISKLSTRMLFDERGYPHLCIDEEVRNRLKAKLVTKVLTFKAA